MDGVPLLSQADAWRDFEEHCPKAAPWVAARYQETARFGHDHVWLRHDLARDGRSEPDVTQPSPTR